MPQWWLHSVTLEPEIEEDLEQSGAIALTTLPIVAKPEPEQVLPEPPKLEQIAPAIAEAPPTVIEPPPTQLPEELIEEIPEELEEDEQEEFEQEPDPPLENLDDNQFEADTDNNEPEAGIAIQFNDDFPHIAGAQSGCFGLENCRIVDGQSFRDVAKAILQDLEAKGYELTPYDNSDSGGGNHRIYEMRQLSDSDIALKYLNIFGEGLTGAFYVITPELIERGDLESLGLG
ncbi:MAG: hypothetical protein F6K11_28140 [Leptolyngbya sp. SIO3F4]|nr:hypothetical protein [Leptolyngbya sp. SIO3F4]